MTWTLVLSLLVSGKAKALTVAGYGTESECGRVAVAYAMEAIRMGMTLVSFECVPGVM